MERRLYLIDASVYVFRAWFSIPDTVSDPAGNPAHAVFGFGRFLCDLIERRQPSALVCAFDESLTTSFRNELYPEYKANRPPPPEDLTRQFGICRRFAEGLGVKTLASDRFEADDLIGTVAGRFRPHGFNMVYVTADKDYAQLLEDRDHWWDAARDRWLDAAGVADNMGVQPGQVVDLLALAGDSIDNIPGVPGIGQKTAIALLQAFGDLDGIYANLAQVPALSVRGAKRVHRLLTEHREQAFLSRTLACIHRDAPVECTPDEVVWSGVCADTLEGLDLPVQLRNRARHLRHVD